MASQRNILIIALLFVSFLIWQAWQKDHEPKPVKANQLTEQMITDDSTVSNVGQSITVKTSYLLLIIIGALGGYFLVPLNALLQNFGKQTIGAGSAIAVQNCGEYSGMMIMLGLYSMSVVLGFPTILIGVGFGILFSLAITTLWLWQKRK